MARTSRSSQELEDSTLPLSGLDSDASAKSSETNPARKSSNDTGLMSRAGETLLPTPDAGNFNDGQTTEAWRARKAKERAKKINGNGGGTPIAMTVKLLAEGIMDPNTGDLTSSSEDSRVSQSARQDAAEPKAMSDGSGPTSPVSFARFNPDGSVSRTYADSSVQVSLLGTHYERFSGTWPFSGSMRDGVVYEHQMSELPTDANGYSSLLPTPEAWLGRRPGSASYDPTREASRRHEGKRGQRSRTLPDVIVPMLPTPRTSDTNGTGTHGTGGKDLRTSIGELSSLQFEEEE